MMVLGCGVGRVFGQEAIVRVMHPAALIAVKTHPGLDLIAGSSPRPWFSGSATR